jgi:hypothetical protein
MNRNRKSGVVWGNAFAGHHKISIFMQNASKCCPTKLGLEGRYNSRQNKTTAAWAVVGFYGGPSGARRKCLESRIKRNGGFPHCSTSDPLKIHSKYIFWL